MFIMQAAPFGMKQPESKKSEDKEKDKKQDKQVQTRREIPSLRERSERESNEWAKLVKAKNDAAKRKAALMGKGVTASFGSIVGGLLGRFKKK